MMTEIKDVRFEKANELYTKVMETILQDADIEYTVFDLLGLAGRLRILSFITYMDATRKEAPSPEAFEDMMEKFLEQDAITTNLTAIYKDKLMRDKKNDGI